MADSLFNCDEELVKILNYAFSEDEYSFTLMLDNNNKYNNNNYVDVCKTVSDDKHVLSINSIDKHIEVSAVHCRDYDGNHANRIDMSFGESSNGEVLKKFTLDYYFFNYASKHPFEKISLSSFRKPRVIYFESPNGKITTNTTFTEYNSMFRICNNFIDDYDNRNLYSPDGKTIKLLSRYDKYRSKERIIPTKEQVDSIDTSEERWKLVELISEKYPQYNNEILYQILLDFTQKYKEHFEGLYNDRLKEVKEAINKRNIMLDARKEAPFFNSEELNLIIDYIEKLNDKNNNYLNKVVFIKKRNGGRN